jgi:outer membrane protein
LLVAAHVFRWVRLTIIVAIGRFGVSTARLSLVTATLVAAILVLATAARAASAEIKLAYVDIQRALNECSAGRKAKDEFRAKVQRLEHRLRKQQEEVKALKDELDTKGLLMKPEERHNLEEEYNRKVRDFERAYNDSKQDLQHEDSEITGRIVRELAVVVSQIGQRDGYTMVMEKGGLLWAAPGVDITDQVIRIYDEKSGGKKLSQSRAGTLHSSTSSSSSSSSSQSHSALPRSTISK